MQRLFFKSFTLGIWKQELAVRPVLPVEAALLEPVQALSPGMPIKQRQG